MRSKFPWSTSEVSGLSSYYTKVPFLYYQSSPLNITKELVWETTQLSPHFFKFYLYTIYPALFDVLDLSSVNVRWPKFPNNLSTSIMILYPILFPYFIFRTVCQQFHPRFTRHRILPSLMPSVFSLDPFHIAARNIWAPLYVKPVLVTDVSHFIV